MKPRRRRRDLDDCDVTRVDEWRVVIVGPEVDEDGRDEQGTSSDGTVTPVDDLDDLDERVG